MAVIQDNDDGYYGTAYTYDALGNITSVVPATISASGSYTSVTDTTEVTYGYNYKNQLSAIYTPSTNYYFTYDAFGNTTSISAWYATLAQYSYNSNNGKINTVTYGNGLAVRYVYDELDNVKEVWYTVNGTETKAYEYSYTAYGQLARFDDLIAGQSVVYSYDSNRRLTHMISFDTESMTNELSQKVTYDGSSRVSHVHYSLDYNTPGAVTNYKFHYFYTYKEGDQIAGMDISTNQFDGGIDYAYDDYGRLDLKTINFVSKTDSSRSFTNTIRYYYRQRVYAGTVYTSAEVNTYISTVNNNAHTYTYGYDDGGNITQISSADGSCYYAYDEMGQLIREDNQALDRTFVYTYDNNGNILIKAIFEYTRDEQISGDYWLDSIYYEYGDSDWKDKLTSYDGQTITYDTIGNPTVIGSATLTWRGRQLTQYVNGSNTYAYTYNDEGIRTSKTINGVTHTYHLSGSQIVAEEWGNNLLVYLYDAEGAPLGMQYRNTSYAANVFDTYWFEKNMQGDIVAVYNDAGTLLISYLYDAWGNVTTTYSNGGASTNAVYNPFKCRGYYHDSETGFYYVSSRYYDPEIGRWVSPEPNVYNGEFDEGAGLIGYNVYAYCANNPVNCYDPTGEFVISTLLICVAAGAIIGGTVGGIAGNAYANSKGYTGWNKTKSILTGIGIGGFAGGALGYFAAPAVVSATGVAGISITSGGISTIAALGTSFGKLGTLIANNGQQIIDWGKTTWHGMQRMLERGVTQNMVEVWAKTGKALQQAGDKILYITKQGAVVIDKAGKVITAYTSQYFDPAMQEVVEKLFGK